MRARALPGQALDDDLDRAGQAGFPVDIAGVEDQGRRDEFVECELAAAARAGEHVLGQPPAGIEGQAVRRHRQAAQQRLEARKRGHGLNPVDVMQQGGDRRVGDDAVRAFQRLRRRNRAAPDAGVHIRMRLVDDERVGVSGAHALKKLQIGSDVRRAEANRSVVLDLTRNKDARSTLRERDFPLLRLVVFR